MKHVLNVFVNALWMMVKTVIVALAFIATMTFILAPAFWFALNLHWSVGVIHAVLWTATLITALMLWHERSKSDSPVWDWLEKAIPERKDR